MFKTNLVGTLTLELLVAGADDDEVMMALELLKTDCDVLLVLFAAEVVWAVEETVDVVLVYEPVALELVMLCDAPVFDLTLLVEEATPLVMVLFAHCPVPTRTGVHPAGAYRKTA